MADPDAGPTPIELVSLIERRMLDRYVESCPPADALAFTGAEAAFRRLSRRAGLRRIGILVGRLPAVGGLARRAVRALRRARGGDPG